MATPRSLISCPDALKILADFWNLRIIETLASEALRFCALQRDLDDVNPATLTKKLTELEQAKLVARTAETNGHQVTYSLTPLGRDALPVLTAIKQFSVAYRTTTAKPYRKPK